MICQRARGRGGGISAWPPVAMAVLSRADARAHARGAVGLRRDHDGGVARAGPGQAVRQVRRLVPGRLRRVSARRHAAGPDRRRRRSTRCAGRRHPGRLLRAHARARRGRHGAPVRGGAPARSTARYAVKVIHERPGAPARARSPASSARRAPPAASTPSTSSRCSTCSAPPTAAPASSPSCSTARTCRMLPRAHPASWRGRGDPDRCARSAARWPRRTRAAWSTATSSRRTSSCAATTRPASSLAKVLDFGVAKLTRRRASSPAPARWSARRPTWRRSRPAGARRTGRWPTSTRSARSSTAW